ncbi:acyl-CoA desaturase [Candidatus Chloroploca sp. Khr17]|uniref:acyl-CoA desaturase n=1 Tax=Candidatus Chloroploca sp. Khr17 TaxID=2496869 RepID=UPI00101C4C7D|nr:acyl-CoA desaturase [Candidatus Chloroploca sp. Khr17]
MARTVPNRVAEEPVIEKSWAEKLVVLAVVVIPFLGTIVAIVMLWNQWVNWVDLTLMLVLYIISGLGITVGFHRLLTHKSFETTWWMKRLMLISGSMALEGDPITWASTHIQHHAHSDGEDDPHSPLEGLWHAHVGWMFNHKHKVDVYGTWLKKDPDVVWVAKTWVLWVAVGLIIPTLIAGWSGLLWGGLVRIFLTHHITWSVNSICHTFGRRDYQTRDASRNNFLVGLLAFGEGWHNNHHAFPRSAFHGLRWWQIDFSAYLIRGLERVGLVWNVVRVKETDLQRRVIPATADGMGD